MPKLLFDSRIAAKPKTFHGLSPLKSSVRLTEEQLGHIADIVGSIQAGKELPAYCYRRNIDSTDDAVLRDQGIMHLHIGSQSSMELMYIMQYENDVLFLEVAGHYFKDEVPAGATIYSRNQTKIKKHEAEIDRLAAEKASLAKPVVKTTERPRGTLTRKP